MKQIIIFLTVILLTTGCTKLDKEPLGVVSETSAYQLEADAIKAITSVYNTLLNFPGYDGYSIYDIAADDAEKGGEGPSDGDFNEIAYSTLTSSNSIAASAWQNCYLGIHRANLVIENIPGIQMDQTMKDRIIGEAKFLRAYDYFILVTLFGDVPLITTAEIENDKTERTSKDLVYEQIIKDLTESIDVLPLKSQLPPAEWGRVTKGAAQAYLGKVFLYQRNFPDAEIWFSKVIESNEYSLDPDYYKIFTIAGEFGSENIFEINYTYNPQFPSASNLGTIRQGSAGMYGYGFTCPTQDFVDEFEQDDPRLGKTVYANGDILPDGKVANVGNSETGYMDKKAYLMQSEFPSTGDPRNSGKNDIKFRYGMLLLWYAEAANQNGHTQQAQDALNEVRNRARQENAGILPDVTATDKDQLEAKIWHEERVEYGMENLRFFDLVRQQRAGTVLRAFAAKYNTVKGRGFKDGVNEVLPIPQTEIDLSQGKLTQNQGY
ncbi:MAG TPA: RagB/SusD family nutrient uptake outer membrane protein [Flavitalea sp.]|nr:RagB/SusD family nutrient uptake outer membrane protein [Flavitalea sp.]